MHQDCMSQKCERLLELQTRQTAKQCSPLEDFQSSPVV